MKLADLAALAEKATPGQRHLEGNLVYAEPSSFGDREWGEEKRYICDVKFPIDDPEIKANADLIVACTPERVLAMCRALESAREALREHVVVKDLSLPFVAGALAAIDALEEMP